MKPFVFQAIFILSILFIFSLSQCSSPEPPLDKMKKDLASATSYSIILEDMREEGMFSKTYYHQYRVIRDNDSRVTGWEEVPKKFYEENKNYLGMTLASKVEGVEDSTVSPPGYNYVGNQQYGHWVNDGRGGSFWEFYGKYAFFSSLFGGWYRPIYRTDYSNYGQYRSQRKPYFGKNNEFGSGGSIVKQKKPDFYQRHMGKASTSRTSFSDKVSQRVGRSRTTYRGRSGGFGK